jgi:hypothetical protein
MTTLESSEKPSSPLTDAKHKAEEVLRKLKQQQEDDLPWVTKPVYGERKILWFDANKFEEDMQDDKYAPKTEDNPNPQRKVFIFTVKTKKDQEKTFTLEPGQAIEVFQILSRKEGGCSWIEVSREATKKGGTKLSFLAL